MTQPPRKRPSQPPPSASGFPPVSPIWLAKALGITFLIALSCAYITLCALYYQGSWQLVLHPKHTATAPSSIDGNPFETIHFSPNEAALPQLTGWWIPAARPARLTLLYLPGANGSLAGSLQQLALLHNLDINVFAFDYRGYGQSAATPHPTQQTMAADTAATFQYLTITRKIPANTIIPFGTGIGASLATSLAAAHPAIPALILDNPQGDLLSKALKDPRSSLVPARLLFRDTFPLAKPLATLHTPKLLLSSQPSPNLSTAATPRMTVELPSPSPALFTQAITRFLDRYLPAPSPNPQQ